MKYWFLVSILILAITLALTATAQDVVIREYGFYGAVDSQSMVTNPATVAVEDTPVGFFTTANPRAYLYIEFETIKAPFEIIFEWVDPTGVKVAEIPVRNTEERTFTSYWVWASLTLNEDRPLGVWTANVYYNGEKILEAPFLLQTPQKIVDSINQLTTENEHLASKFETATAQLADLQNRNSQLESEISNLRADINTALTENNALKNTLEQAQAENRNLSARLSSETARANGLDQQRLIFMITTGVMAAVAAMVAVVGRRGRAVPVTQATSVTQAIQQSPSQLNYCPSCGAQLQYVSQYQKYWCPAEQKYV